MKRWFQVTSMRTGNAEHLTDFEMQSMHRAARLSVLASLLFLGTGCEPPEREAAPRSPARPNTNAPRPAQLGASGYLYLPIYSHIYVQNGIAEDLAVTVSVRNMSMHDPLVVESVRYYDTRGKSLGDFLEAEAIVGPLETIEFFVPTDDQRGGSGANVVVAWHAESEVVEPLVEAVMVHSYNANKAHSFTTRALEVPPASTRHQPQGAAPPRR